MGAAIVTGYKRAIAEEVEVTCVMGADGQMDPDDLETLVQAIASGGVDYAKAKRKLGWEPKVRFKALVEMMVDADLERLKAGSR